MKVAELVQENIKSKFDKDIKLVEVEYVKRSDGMHLVVYIDKDTGITIDDCVEVSRMIDPIIDELNPTGDDTYVLDVSSYGLDKPLKYDWQFKKYLNKKVDMNLILWQQVSSIADTFSYCVRCALKKNHFAEVEETTRPFSVFGYVDNGKYYGNGWDGVGAQNICGYSQVFLDNIYMT